MEACSLSATFDNSGCLQQNLFRSRLTAPAARKAMEGYHVGLAGMLMVSTASRRCYIASAGVAVDAVEDQHDIDRVGWWSGGIEQPPQSSSSSHHFGQRRSYRHIANTAMSVLYCAIFNPPHGPLPANTSERQLRHLASRLTGWQQTRELEVEGKRAADALSIVGGQAGARSGIVALILKAGLY